MLSSGNLLAAHPRSGKGDTALRLPRTHASQGELSELSEYLYLSLSAIRVSTSLREMKIICSPALLLVFGAMYIPFISRELKRTKRIVYRI